MANTNKIILLFIAIHFLAFSFATTNETDHQALLDIKNHIQIDPFHVLESWNDSIHFCNWQGITCGKRHQRVTVLSVSYLDLVGTLSPYVGNLTFLKEIRLNGNLLHGIIPSEIGRLFRLQILDFGNNSFQGQIPVSFTMCKNLRFIQLYNNKLNGRIPGQLSALTNLHSLVLATNSFTGYIPRSIGNISTLQILDLSQNYLSGNIPYEIGKLFNLQGLGLGTNMLSGLFPITIYNMSSIQIISIPLNHLTGQFPDNLGLRLPKLTHFFVGSNNFSGLIPSTLPNASNLLKIDVGNNMLTGPIPRNLGRLQQLQMLQLFNNPLGEGIDIDTLIATLSNCTNLEILDLGGIEIGGILPLEISNLSRKLTNFTLNDNRISGNLPKGIGDLVGLNIFALNGNDLSGNIPLSIANLINLESLFLYDNNFIGEIPPSIGDISGLLVLSLDQCMLTGSIPLSIRNLTKLEVLELSENKLNGSLPKELFSMNSPLITIFLNHNKFIGPVPLEIGNLKHLNYLNVAENELSGEIPVSLGTCQMLEDLKMDGNFLEGISPSSIVQLINIDFMDLSRNKLSGEIPASFEKLKFVTFLNLSFNMLEGEVPINGVFANASILSLVGNIELCGGIKSLGLPVCLSNDSKKHEKMSTHIIIILVICIIVALVSSYVCVFSIYKKKKSGAVPSLASPSHKQLLKISYAEILTSTNGFSSENLRGDGKYGSVYRGVLKPGEKLIAVKVIKLQLKGAHKSLQALYGFSSENLIGEGKYGSVYRGVLKPDEKVVAVKVLKLQLKGAHKIFLAECEALRNIRHRNLVKIITSCSSIDFKGNDFKALILEYVSNGSLEEWLHQNPTVQVNEKYLDFSERLNIAIDIATALDYLHNHSGNPIVHCDIKPSNVLLGDDLRGLLSDFGLAKFLPMGNDISHDIESTSIGIRGTFGYVAPEYGMGGDVSTKGDIYSYGILLLEMFTGKRPTDPMFIEEFSLHNYVKTALDHRVVEIIDPKLLMIDDNEENKSNYTSTKIESCCTSIFRVGLSCSSEMKNDRMDINEALIQLQHVRNGL